MLALWNTRDQKNILSKMGFRTKIAEDISIFDYGVWRPVAESRLY
jgi:hypothetical protein